MDNEIKQMVHHQMSAAIHIHIACQKLRDLAPDEREPVLKLSYCATALMGLAGNISFGLYKGRMLRIMNEPEAVRFEVNKVQGRPVYIIYVATPVSSCDHEHHVYSAIVTGDKAVFDWAQEEYAKLLVAMADPADMAKAKADADEALRKAMH